MTKHEWDDLIEVYRVEQNKAIAISGHTEDFFAEHRVKKLKEWLPDLDSRRIAVLDYGCSDGLMTSIFKKNYQNAEVYGIDPSSKSIEYAARHYPDIKFAALENKSLPYAASSMDLIFAVGVFHHILFDEHDIYLREIFRALKPGGHFVLFELNPFNPATIYVFNTCIVDRDAKFMFPHYSRKLLKKYGPVEVKYYAFFPKFLEFMQPLEKYLTKLPIAALYAMIVEKPPPLPGR